MSFNPDTVPSYPVQRGNIYGAKCPITGQEFLNLTVNGEGREEVDATKSMNSLVAAQKLHTHSVIYNMDGGNVGNYVSRNLSVEDRRRLWLSENA